MNIEWTFRDADDGKICATAHITTSDGSWAIVKQRGHIIGFTSYGDVGQEIVEAAVEILRRYTETGKIWVPVPHETFMDLPCRRCGRPVRVKDDSLDGVCEDMFAAGEIVMLTDADIDRHIRAIQARENGWSDRPNDSGGPTNDGITLALWIEYHANPDLRTTPGWVRHLRAATDAEKMEFYRWYFSTQGIAGLMKSSKFLTIWCRW